MCRKQLLPLQVKITNMKEHLRTSKQVIEQIVNPETGEVEDIQVTNHQYLAGNPDEFYLAYTALLNVWAKWDLSVSDLNLYAYLCKNYANGTPFNISEYVKKEVANITGRSATSFNNSPRALVSKGLIIRVSNKTYKINPRYIFKGSSSNRNKALFEILQTNKEA